MEDKRFNIETINWHDAVLKKVHIDVSENKYAKITLECQVYMTNQDTHRTPVLVRFDKVKRESFTFHAGELYRNATAGNISGLYVYKKVYQFSMFGGYFEIAAQNPPKVSKVS